MKALYGINEDTQLARNKDDLPRTDLVKALYGINEDKNRKPNYTLYVHYICRSLYMYTVYVHYICISLYMYTIYVHCICRSFQDIAKLFS